MYFSCDDKILLLKNYSIITRIIEDEGFTINQKKVHFHTPSNKKQITGITVTPTNIEDYFELKAPRKLKQKIRAEIFTCLVSGQYQNKEHILGEISYVNFIEKENKCKYLDRIKTYINKQAIKIQIFPELVTAYNKNKFFDDSPSFEVTDISEVKESEFEFLKFILEERKNFLQKNEIKDICRYSNWPAMIINSVINNVENTIDTECPF